MSLMTESNDAQELPTRLGLWMAVLPPRDHRRMTDDEMIAEARAQGFELDWRAQ
jgi:hypothetical protein